MKRIAILVSGNGSNMLSIINSTKFGILKGIAEVVLVISNNNEAKAIKKAQKENIKKIICLNEMTFNSKDTFDNELLSELYIAKIDLICLAGYIKKISKKIIEIYSYKILNVHPALLPKFGGKGMYGKNVHLAVLKSKEQETGATIHFVDENYDTGSIIIKKKIKIFKKDDIEDIANKVLKIEHDIYPKAIKKVIETMK
ncbi:MAG: phosphoribosylglycinamide formyltransferase [Endomicrobium sp.]|jgi:phosphoribosylglycinamide formyltransferase-1|nr:phosphoribosylglycinamide formyltransferase [Endomicrobium sp.]